MWVITLLIISKKWKTGSESTVIGDSCPKKRNTRITTHTWKLKYSSKVLILCCCPPLVLPPTHRWLQTHRVHSRCVSSLPSGISSPCSYLWAPRWSPWCSWASCGLRRTRLLFAASAGTTRCSPCWPSCWPATSWCPCWGAWPCSCLASRSPFWVRQPAHANTRGWYFVLMFKKNKKKHSFFFHPFLVVLVHASVRLRNLKNKMENKLESIGLKRTPMGLLLEALGQEQEAGS